MSEVDSNVAVDGDEPLDAKLGEDDESAWLRARRRNPDTSPPSPTLAHEHAQLENILGSLPPIRVEDSWHDDVLKDASRARSHSPRGRWGAALLSIALVAGGATLWYPRTVRDPELVLELHRKQAMRGNELSPSIGDDLVVTARTDSDSELRVYRNNIQLLARCPGNPRCAYLGGPRNEQTLKLSLTMPGEYDIILMVSTGRAFPDASMDQYLSAAIGANARFVSQQVRVR